jgi:hypothetical protein
VQQGKSVVVIDRPLINDDPVRGGVGRCGWRMGA